MEGNSGRTGSMIRSVPAASATVENSESHAQTNVGRMSLSCSSPSSARILHRHCSCVPPSSMLGGEFGSGDRIEVRVEALAGPGSHPVRPGVSPADRGPRPSPPRPRAQRWRAGRANPRHPRRWSIPTRRRCAPRIGDGDVDGAVVESTVDATAGKTTTPAAKSIVDTRCWTKTSSPSSPVAEHETLTAG